MIIVGFHENLWDLVMEHQEIFSAAGVNPQFLSPEEVNPRITNPIILPFFASDSRDLFSLTVSAIKPPVVAAVEDTTGHPAHQAICAGAMCAVNILLPPSLWLGPMLSILQGATEINATAEGRSLAELLCGTSTVPQIAKILCCSERSAYRRIRELYRATNVRNRSEFKAAMEAQRLLP